MKALLILFFLLFFPNCYTGEIKASSLYAIVDVETTGLNPNYHLAWLVETLVHSINPNDELPIHRWKILIDANNGKILEQKIQINN